MMQSRGALVAHRLVAFGLLAVCLGAHAGEDVKCDSFVKLKCDERATFSGTFDSERETASVSPVPEGMREKDGAASAAQCYSEHWKQIPMLAKMLQRGREGKGPMPTTFTFEIVMHCDDFLEPVIEPAS